MELKNILMDLEKTAEDGVVKTASVKKRSSSEKVSSARTELLGALNDILVAPAVTKTASAQQSAVGELTKMASDLANADAEALVKEAQFWGAAVADEFVARLGQHVDATDGYATKTASADGIPTQAEFEKFAEENPDLVKQAVELGYYHGKAQLAELQGQTKTAEQHELQQVFEKLAETPEGQEKLAAVEQGYNDTTEKLAAVEQGYNDTTEKLAAVEQGYNDTTRELVKMANDTFTRGYNDTIRILQNMA